MSLYILNRKILNISVILFVFIFFIKTDCSEASYETTSEISEATEQTLETKDDLIKINQIIITRNNKNNYLTDEAILNVVPYQSGEVFIPNKTTVLIQNLFDIGKPFSFFNQVQVMAEELDDNLMNLHIITYEKSELKEVVITGNKKVQKKDIDELFIYEDIHAINELDLKKIILEIKKLYRDKDFHLTEIEANLTEENGKVIANIAIHETKKSLIKRVFFKGNHNINDKKLREIIFTREDWILGFINKAGSYRPENLEIDKHILENYYKSNGYFMAAVTNADVVMDPITKQYNVTFTIQEGDLYCIKEVKVEGNDLLSEEFLLDLLPVKKDNIYSAKDLRDSLELLRTLWGQYGYVFADIEPIIIPDEKTKSISITFNLELGDKVYVNRINILGNKKTKENVIRRRLIIDEGDLLTTPKMDVSKDRVTNLGYFDAANGVNWKINRTSDQFADLDLIVNEVKTGRIIGNVGVGGSPKDIYSISKTFKFGGSVYDTNLFGEGLQFKLSAEWSKEESTAAFNLVNPYFLNRPVYTEFECFVTKSEYGEELKNVSGFNQRLIGVFLGTGFSTSSSSWLSDTAITFKIGLEDIENNHRPKIFNNEQEGSATLQAILDRRFQAGRLIWLINRNAQDTRNHILHPTRGYQWSSAFRMGFDGGKGNLGLVKWELDASWYTPLIGENTLILGMHGFFGIVGCLDNKIIPYRELFHIGGPASVRGFTYGQIGPTFLGDSIGGKKAFFINTELIFPVTKDFSVKAALFYDGGAGWDTPDADKIPSDSLKFLRNNKFEYRHSIGIGIRMLKPTPVKIDWGFKLDRKKGEPESELHLSAYRDF